MKVWFPVAKGSSGHCLLISIFMLSFVRWGSAPGLEPRDITSCYCHQVVCQQFTSPSSLTSLPPLFSLIVSTLLQSIITQSIYVFPILSRLKSQTLTPRGSPNPCLELSRPTVYATPCQLSIARDFSFLDPSLLDPFWSSLLYVCFRSYLLVYNFRVPSVASVFCLAKLAFSISPSLCLHAHHRAVVTTFLSIFSSMFDIHCHVGLSLVKVILHSFLFLLLIS